MGKKTCKVFTPPDMVVYMLDKIGYTDDLLGKKVLENSCGTGHFLQEIVRRYIRDGRTRQVTDEDIKSGLEADIHGYEKDSEVYEQCLANLDKTAAELGIHDVAWHITKGDALRAELSPGYQYVIGNPPYITYYNLDSEDRALIRRQYEVCRVGKADYYYAFTEAALKSLAADGKMAYLIPNNFMKNRYSQALREYLIPYLTEIEDYKFLRIFGNYQISSAIIFCENQCQQDDFKYTDQEIGDILYDKTHMLVAGSEKQKEPHPENETEVLIYNSDEASVTPDEEGADQPISSGEISLVIKEIIKLHEQGVRFEDITLLAPTRNTYLDLMANFEEHGIPLVPDEYKSSYLESLEVMIMLDTLRAINNPLNDYALVALLRSPMFNFNEDDLARIAVQADKGQFYDKLLAAHTKSGLHPEVVTQGLEAKLTLFIETLSDWRDYSKWHSLYDLIWKIYDDRFYYDYVGSLPRAEQRQANLYALALRANAYEKTGFKGLSRFIGMIDKIISSGNDLEEVTDLVPKNAVSLMTIHKSKGLEFKYVFVLQMNRKFIGHSKDGLSGKYIINREKGLGIKYLADLKDQVNTNLPKLNVVLETLTFQENRREERRASISEEMRLLYVAMTRAEKKLYLVGKGSKEKLTQQFGTDVENNRLPVALRDQIATYQDWVMALDTAFMRKDLKFTVRFVEAEDLTPEAIGQVEVQAAVDADDLSNNRQTEDIKRALTVLESVEKLNQLYAPAIDLPSVRTPSQLKAFYEPVMDTEGVDIMDKKEEVQPLETTTSFELPDFGQKTKVTGAAVGSATHELMQRLILSDKVTLQDLTQALSRVSADDQVKARVQLEKLLGFFDTELGKLILANRDKLRREAPFAMLAEDPASKEDFVVRGIIDGYLLLEDRIVLFDYKTDRFTQPGELKERYKGQMSLYAKALSQAYQIDKIDKYLILLGGKDLEVVEV